MRDIDPEQIGVMGFSSGGHLASTLGIYFDQENPLGEELVISVKKFRQDTRSFNNCKVAINRGIGIDFFIPV